MGNRSVSHKPKHVNLGTVPWKLFRKLKKVKMETCAMKLETGNWNLDMILEIEKGEHGNLCYGNGKLENEPRT